MTGIKMMGISMMYTNGQAPMRELPMQTSRKLADIPQNTVVIHTGKREEAGGMTTATTTAPMPVIEYMEVEYDRWRGWVYAGYLDDYVENLPKHSVATAMHTPDAKDPEQFISYNGARQVNLCGEFCAAYVLGLPLEMILNKWEQTAPAFWTRIFGRKNGAKVAGGTTPADLISLFSAFDLKATDLTQAMTDPILKRSRYTVGGLQRLLEKRWVIASVNIDRVTGRLRGAGVLHWVAINKAQDERTGYGYIEIYNPFPNRIEAYSWEAFVASARMPYGVAIDGAK